MAGDFALTEDYDRRRTWFAKRSQYLGSVYLGLISQCVCSGVQAFLELGLGRLNLISNWNRAKNLYLKSDTPRCLAWRNTKQRDLPRREVLNPEL